MAPINCQQRVQYNNTLSARVDHELKQYNERYGLSPSLGHIECLALQQHLLELILRLKQQQRVQAARQHCQQSAAEFSTVNSLQQNSAQSAVCSRIQHRQQSAATHRMNKQH